MYRGFNRQRITECCKDCPDRYPACHDKCEKYKTAKAEWDERRELIKAEKSKAVALDLYQKAAVWRIKKLH